MSGACVAAQPGGALVEAMMHTDRQTDRQTDTQAHRLCMRATWRVCAPLGLCTVSSARCAAFGAEFGNHVHLQQSVPIRLCVFWRFLCASCALRTRCALLLWTRSRSSSAGIERVRDPMFLCPFNTLPSPSLCSAAAAAAAPLLWAGLRVAGVTARRRAGG
jgi:hypothetical protein